MKKFNIELFDKHIIEIDDGDGYPFKGCECKITIGDYENIFHLSIDTLWTYEQYKQQWKEGVKRLKTHDNSCLVIGIGMVEKYKRPAMTIWKLYKVEDTVFITWQIISTDLTKGLPVGTGPAYSQTCYQLVKPRLTNENGEYVDHNGIELWEKSLSVEDFFSGW